MGEPVKPIYSFKLGSFPVEITQSIIVQWIIMLVLIVIAIVLTSDLKEVPKSRKQNIVEIFVDTVKKLVRDNMGENCIGFVPYIGTLAIFLLTMNLTGLIGVKPPTEDYSVAVALATITFFVIQGYAIKKVGIGHYFLGYGKPFVAMLPLNIMERVMLPVSLSLRLFGNLFAAGIIMELVYHALSSISIFAAIGLPVPLHAYFDIFDGAIQMAIFTMLTMINIKMVAEH